MKFIKSIFNKLAILSLALIFAAGCASVTDANTDLLEDNSPVISVEKTTDTWDSNGDAMDPIRGDRPNMGE
jgi:hypothetical protein